MIPSTNSGCDNPDAKIKRVAKEERISCHLCEEEANEKLI